MMERSMPLPYEHYTVERRPHPFGGQAVVRRTIDVVAVAEECALPTRSVSDAAKNNNLVINPTQHTDTNQ